MELDKALLELLKIYKIKEFLSCKDLAYVANKYSIPMELLLRCIRIETIKFDE